MDEPDAKRFKQHHTENNHDYIVQSSNWYYPEKTTLQTPVQPCDAFGTFPPLPPPDNWLFRNAALSKSSNWQYPENIPLQPSVQTDNVFDTSPSIPTANEGLIEDRTQPQNSNITSSNFICFGMLVLSVTPVYPTSLRGIGAVRLGESGQLWTDAVVATLSTRDTELLELLYSENFDLEICAAAAALPPGRVGLQSCHSARVILYGPEDLGTELKDVLNSTGFFLQDPIGASHDVVYLNPQRLFNSPGARTSHISSREELAVEQEEAAMVDVLAQFTTQIDLTPTEGSSHLLTPLQLHQKQALTFMRNREAGWNLMGIRTDLWSMKKKLNGDTGYVNNIDKSFHFQQPPSFRGGILADNMGSGKSLSMIALIAHDITHRTLKSNDITPLQHKPCHVKTTLLIMPPSLLQNWQQELIKHLGSMNCKWRCHHGPSKITNAQDLETLDIVLVTYPTLATEWRASRKTSILFNSRWNRLIIDEAHCIKDPSAVTTQAVCDINSSSRWAVTGTPIQNNLCDLQSLLKFLRIHPYDDKDTFDDHFTSLWRSGEGVLATNRLKQLLRYIMLRRSGGHIVLPDRVDLKMYISFNEREMQMYHEAKEKALEFINDVLSSQNAKGGYKNAIHKINHLRLICNHGLWQPNDGCGERKLETEMDSVVEWWSSTAAHKALSQFSSLGLPMTCIECNSLVHVNMPNFDARLLEPMPSVKVHLTRCLQLWCTSCYSLRETLPTPFALCNCDTECPIATVQLDALSRSPSPLAVDVNRHHELQDYPTKIRALLDDVQRIPTSTKSIVFSFWKTTLDIARTALNEAGITCVQIDGKVKPKDRKAIFEKFQTDDTTRILLLSLSCGAVGLTLTAASRVYLMEPQWNPSLEEQALARVYRIGQTQNVTTIRFLMKDSIEKYVTDIQDKKKDLISILLSARSQVSHQRLQELRDWLK